MKRYPLIAEISTHLTATETFEVFRQRPYSFFLDSGMDYEKLGRYSFLGSDPFLIMKSRGEDITLSRNRESQVRKGNPFDVAKELLEEFTIESCPVPVPFAGGAVGYFSYDLCHFIERLPSTAVDDLNLPECYLAFYDIILVFDHMEGQTYIISSGFPEQDEDKRLERAGKRMQALKERLQDSSSMKSTNISKIGNSKNLRSNFTRQEYMRAVETAREYIAAGDIFQVNLSQRFEVDTTESPFELYKRMSEINPAPFAAYLDLDEVTIVSASPERFLKVNGDRVETRPMKGTRPRGTTESQDEALARELKSSIKDRAENVMIVDLERNDLGRVCRFGTVKVNELWTLERYATVFQLTSNIEGVLNHGKSRIDLLKACFPGGSITGAPKVRAMEIIDELEPTRRSIYTGALGYLSFSGEMDLNIVIRTIIVKDGRAYFQVGGGIVYDSDPELEYQETMDKAEAMFQTLSSRVTTTA